MSERAQAFAYAAQWHEERAAFWKQQKEWAMEDTRRLDYAQMAGVGEAIHRQSAAAMRDLSVRTDGAVK